MYEFHAWATIRVEDNDEDLDVLTAREEKAIEQLKEVIEAADDKFSLFELTRTGNGMIVFLAHGLCNHRYEPVLDVFRWITKSLPDSYGLLYIHDDEDHREGEPESDNCFRVWKMALGKLTEESDPYLSPYIPTVEKPWSEIERSDLSNHRSTTQN
ncbi:MAG: hypothetical protein KA314_23600 [Chloroflexi bacterium]|nr:hypothetical protein [Chloroflexota bacterium]MBP8058830.1 hypothetical protein [Chloroflexota bacterium]